MEKQCFKCGVTKPLDDFYRHRQMADGHLNKCKSCARADVRQHRIDNPESVRAYDNARAKLPHRKALRKRIQDNFPQEKKRAHAQLRRAVLSGSIKKQPCAFCGADDPVEAHHHDYSKPLEVTWLCVPCHRRFHALERMATYDRDAA